MASRGDTSTSTPRHRRARSRQWRHECTTSCRGTRACTAARATSPGRPPTPTNTHARRSSDSRDGPPTATTSRSSAGTPPRRSITSRTASGSVPTMSSSRPSSNTTPTSCRGHERVAADSSSVHPTAPSTSTTSPAALDATPRPKLLAITGASNVTGWMPPIDDIVLAAHERRVPRLLGRRAARTPPTPARLGRLRRVERPQDVRAVRRRRPRRAPRRAFADGDPFLAGGGAVDLVDLDEVVWTDPPEREEAGSPNVLGAIALHEAIDEFDRIGWTQIQNHDVDIAARLRSALAAIPGVTLLGPDLDDRDLAARDVHRRRRAPLARRRAPERRVRHRRSPRMLLRPPVPRAPPRSPGRTGPRLPRSGPARRPTRHARRSTSQRRALYNAGRHRPPDRSRRDHRRRITRTRHLPARRTHGRLLARQRERRMDHRGPNVRRLPPRAASCGRPRRSHAGDVLDELGKLSAGLGSEKVSLQMCAVQVDERRELLCGLDAFGNNAKVQISRRG